MSVMPSTSPLSTRRKTTLEILEAYESWSLDAIMSFRTPDCVHEVLPTSLPQMDNEGYRTFFAAIMPRVWNFKLTIRDIIEDPEANKVVVFASSTADSKAGVGSYGQQYVLSFEFDEAETRIRKMVEFVDSKKAAEQADILFG